MREFLASSYRDADLSFVIERVESLVLRAPIDRPVQTSFGTMRDRPALFLRLTDSGGSSGTGEVWCNFPDCGAEHRAALLSSSILPALVGKEFSDPASCFDTLQKQFKRLAVQSGEPGPIAQCIAGIDVALWDLVATRIGVPLYRMFGGDSDTINTYASGINPDGAADTVQRCREQGYTGFKLKIGFGDETDFSNLDAIIREFCDDDALMVDANQAWTPAEAMQQIERLGEYSLNWLEEPIMATSEIADWRQLAQNTSIPLAGGENIGDAESFSLATSGDWLDVIQPDLCKWGGFSGAIPVAKNILAAGKRFCPHFLGGGIGLLASGHLLAAVGGDGRLEIDSNPNPLREELFSSPIDRGLVTLNELPGLGVNPGLVDELAARYQVNGHS